MLPLKKKILPQSIGNIEETTAEPPIAVDEADLEFALGHSWRPLHIDVFVCLFVWFGFRHKVPVFLNPN